MESIGVRRRKFIEAGANEQTREVLRRLVLNHENRVIHEGKCDLNDGYGRSIPCPLHPEGTRVDEDIIRFCGRCHRPIMEPQWEVEYKDESEEDWTPSRSHFIHVADIEGCNAQAEMDDWRIFQIIRGFLRYSFKEVHSYDGLTPSEREICSKEEYEDLRKWAFLP